MATVKKKFQALTTEEVAQAMEQSKGAPDRLKKFNELLDDMLWKKNKLKQYKERAMTKDEALKLALEALKQIDEAMPFPVAKLAQAAIKEALAQPEPEYLAFMDTPQSKPLSDEEIGAILEDVNAYGTRLYTFARAIEAKLKEKNT